MKVIVIGLGGMGSAAAAHLAARGTHVIGIERFTPAHDHGSSHGRSRIIRQAYFEDAQYVPLLLRAYELWRELDPSLLHLTGGLMIGAPDSDVVTGSLASARTYGLAHEVLDAAEIRRRFPVLTPGDDVIALYEPMAGFVNPEECTLAHLAHATKHGAELHFEEAVTSWNATANGVRVTTTRATYEADRLVIAPGAWAPELLADLHVPFTIERQGLFWFDAAGFDPFPIYIWELDRTVHFYGFPADAVGVKVALYHGGDVCTPETIDRSVRAEEVERIHAILSSRIPTLTGPLVDATTCMYTNTPDLHFVLGLHPSHANVVVASPCSGHGYKFASVIGEILAGLAIDGATPHAIEAFRPERFGR
jgi:sarcosine oxidase